jgi:cell division protein FtsB
VQRRARTRRLVDAVITAVILGATALCVSVYFRTRAELMGATWRNQSAGDRVAQLRSETERLEREIHQLKTDPRVIEQFARQKLGFVRPGDVVAKFDGARGGSSAALVKVELQAEEVRGR